MHKTKFMFCTYESSNQSVTCRSSGYLSTGLTMSEAPGITHNDTQSS